MSGKEGKEGSTKWQFPISSHFNHNDFFHLEEELLAFECDKDHSALLTVKLANSLLPDSDAWEMLDLLVLQQAIHRGKK